jgi:hypothetical protein
MGYLRIEKLHVRESIEVIRRGSEDCSETERNLHQRRDDAPRQNG